MNFSAVAHLYFFEGLVFDFFEGEERGGGFCCETAIISSKDSVPFTQV